MVYSKPELYVENFIAGINVAAGSCNRDFESMENVLEKQQIQCYRSNDKDWVFSSSASGCSYTPTGIEYIDTTKDKTYYTYGDDFYNAIVASGTGIPSGLTSMQAGQIQTNGGNSSVTVILSGLFAAWRDSQGHTCFGPASGSMVEHYTNSY